MITEPSGMDVFAQPERPGLVYDLPDTIYHSSKSSLSASSAKILLGKRPPVSGWALEFGSLAHAVLLEPDRAEKMYAPLNADEIGVKADGTLALNPTATSAWKKAVADAEKDGLRVVSIGDWERAHRMADAVRGHKAAAEILAACPQTEVSAYAEVEPGVMIRGRFDLFGAGMIADYKTTGDASPDAFERTMGLFGYHISAGNYLWIAELLKLDASEFRFICCERERTPGGKHRVSVLEPDSLALKKGREDMQEAIRRWLALGKFVDLPDYSDDVELVNLPAYLIPDDMDVI